MHHPQHNKGKHQPGQHTQTQHRGPVNAAPRGHVPPQTQPRDIQGGIPTYTIQRPVEHYQIRPPNVSMAHIDPNNIMNKQMNAQPIPGTTPPQVPPFGIHGPNQGQPRPNTQQQQPFYPRQTQPPRIPMNAVNQRNQMPMQPQIFNPQAGAQFIIPVQNAQVQANQFGQMIQYPARAAYNQPSGPYLQISNSQPQCFPPNTSYQPTPAAYPQGYYPSSQIMSQPNRPQVSMQTPNPINMTVPPYTQQAPVAPMPTMASKIERKKTILKIVDPNSGKDIDLFSKPSSDSTPPTSNASSARATPPPAPPVQQIGQTSNVAADFAAQVAQAARQSPAGGGSATAEAPKTVSAPPSQTVVGSRTDIINKDGTLGRPLGGTKSDPNLPGHVIETDSAIAASTQSLTNVPISDNVNAASEKSFISDGDEQNKNKEDGVVSKDEPVVDVPDAEINVHVDESKDSTSKIHDSDAGTDSVHISTKDKEAASDDSKEDKLTRNMPEASKDGVESMDTTDNLATVAEDANVPVSVPNSIPKGDGKVEEHVEAKEKPKQKGKKRMKDLNEKGQKKEGGDVMDAFIDKEPSISGSGTPPPTELQEDRLPNSIDVQIPAKSGSETDELSKVQKNNAINDMHGASDILENDSKPVIQDNKIELKYKYRDDQWSPMNTEGKKTYDREFLLQLQNDGRSRTKPDGLPKLDIIKDTPHLHDTLDACLNLTSNHQFKVPSEPPTHRIRPSPSPSPQPIHRRRIYERDFLLAVQWCPLCCTRPASLPYIPDIVKEQLERPRGTVADFTPNYTFKSPRFQPMRPRKPAGAERRDNKSPIVIKVSINQDINLNKAENAWKPSSYKADPDDPEEKKSQELYKKVRSILNKLTPQKFKTLVEQVLTLNIDTEERLSAVIDLVFEKAVSEPGFSVAYANMCKCLMQIKVPIRGAEGQFVAFRKLLLNKCQNEFENDRLDEIDHDRRLLEIEQAETEERKDILRQELREVDTKSKRRSIGNIRFIGELFKLKILTEPIMHDCLIKLLKNQEDEESLEALCRLLSTVGKDIDGTSTGSKKIDAYVTQMKKIVDARKTSSRIRFMLLDCIDLRRSKWVARRDEGPKTIDQIHRDVEQERHENELARAMYTPSQKKDDRRAIRGGLGPPAAPGNQEWQTVNTKIRSKEIIDPNRLRFSKQSPVDENSIQLGPGGRPGGGFSFGSWGKGSSGGGSKQKEDESRPTPGNRFAALSAKDSISDDRRMTTGNISRIPGKSASIAAPTGGRETPPSYDRDRLPPSRSERRFSAKDSQFRERQDAIAAVRGFHHSLQPPHSRDNSREPSRERQYKSREGSRERQYSSRDASRERQYINRDSSKERMYSSRDASGDRHFLNRDASSDKNYRSRDNW